MRDKSAVFIAICLFVALVAISFSSILIKWCSAPASIMAMYRLALCVVLLLPFTGRQLVRLREHTVRDLALLTTSGVFLGLHFLCWIASLKYTSVASSMIVTALQPLFVMLGAVLFFRERASLKAVLSLGVALLGTVWVALGDVGHGGASSHGDLLSLLGTMAVSVYMLAGQSARSKRPNILSASAYNTAVFSIASIVLLVFNVCTHTPMVGYSLGDWGLFALLAIIPTLFGHALFNWLLGRVSATTISVTVLCEPACAIALACLMLHESVHAFQWAGGAVTMLGVGLYMQSRYGGARSATATQDG